MSWSLVGSAGALVNGNSPVTANCGQASTAGNLLICRVTVTSSSGAPTMPSGWVLRASAAAATSPFAAAYIYEYVNNPGAISSVTISTPGGHIAAQVVEYTNGNVAAATADQAGGSTGSIASPFNVTTPGNLSGNDELVVTATAVLFSASTLTTLSAGTGFTLRGAWAQGNTQAGHASFDDNLDSGAASAGTTVTDAVTMSATGAGHQSAAIATYTAPAVIVTAPVTLGTAATGTIPARSGTATAALAPGTGVTGTSSGRSGTATAHLSLGTSASPITAAVLSLGTAVTGAQKRGSDSGGSAAPLNLAAADTGTVAHRSGTATAHLPLSTPRYPQHLGGAVTGYANTLGGTVSQTAVQWTSGGTLTLYILGGTAVLAVNAGTLDEWTMTPINIVLAEFNDEQLTVTITNNGTAVNLTGYTVDAYFKTKAGVADTDPTTIHLSSAGGSPAITITNAALGQCVINLPAVDLQNASITFYRIDTVDPTAHRNTAIYGTVSVTLL